MRADRLLAILMELQTHGKLAAPELAERLEVSVRTIYRDIESLSAAGVPVYAERGRYGGVTLVPGYHTDLTGLTAAEAQALFVFSGKGAVEELGLGDDLRQAIRKLLATVPETHRGDAERIQQRIVVDPHSWRRGAEDQPHLLPMQQAVLADRRVRVRYPSRSAHRDRDYDLDPYGLVAKAGVWYVLAGTAEGIRTFRVSRIRDLTLLDEHFERPAEIDVDALWNETQARFTRDAAPTGYLVEAVVDHDTVELVRRTSEPFLRSVDGSVVRFEFNGIDHAAVMLIRYGAALEVVAPVELRERLAHVAEAMVERYRPG